MCGCPLNHLRSFWTWLLQSTPFRSHPRKLPICCADELQIFYSQTENAEKNIYSPGLFLDMIVITCVSQCMVDIHVRLNIAMSWWNFLFFICLCEKTGFVFTYFLFSVQLIAAVYPFMSNHQCLYPHIPVPGSYSKLVAVCFMTALKLYLASQCIFTVQAAGVHCSTPHFLSFCHVLLPSCVRYIHPFLSLSISSVSLLLFLTVSFPLSQSGFPWNIWIMC